MKTFLLMSGMLLSSTRTWYGNRDEWFCRIELMKRNHLTGSITGSVGI